MSVHNQSELNATCLLLMSYLHDSSLTVERLAPTSVNYAWLKWTIWTRGLGPVLTQSSVV